MLHHRGVMPWDPSDDLPVSQLLRNANVSTELLDRCRAEYDALPKAGVASFLGRLGVRPAGLAQRYERAMLRNDPLSFDDFITALVAMDPTTAHGGVWNGLRAQYIFRMYDMDEDGRLSSAELARLLGDVRAAYNTPPLPYDESLDEAIRLSRQLRIGEESTASGGGGACGDGGGGGGAATVATSETSWASTEAADDGLSLSNFRLAVGQLRVRGCSRLFRTDTPLLRSLAPVEARDTQFAPSVPHQQQECMAAVATTMTHRPPQPDSPTAASAAAPIGVEPDFQVFQQSDAAFCPQTSRGASPKATPHSTMQADLAVGASSVRTAWGAQGATCSSPPSVLPPPTLPTPTLPAGLWDTSEFDSALPCSPAAERLRSPPPPLSSPLSSLSSLRGDATSSAQGTNELASPPLGDGSTPPPSGGSAKKGSRRGSRGKRGAAEPPSGSPVTKELPSIWKTGARPNTAIPQASAALMATAHAAPASSSSGNTSAAEQDAVATEVANSAVAVTSAAGLAQARLALHTHSVCHCLPHAVPALAITTPTEVAEVSGAKLRTDGARLEAQGSSPTSPRSPVSPTSPVARGEVRFAVKKVVLEHPQTGYDNGPRLIASPRDGMHAPASGGVVCRGADEATGGGCGRSGCHMAQPSVRRQRSVAIDPSDAALKGRKVGMQVSSWLPPPSPAPGKDVAKRVRDALLLSHWSAAALAPNGLGEGSLEYVCTDAELIQMCRLCVERKCWATSALVKCRTPLKLFGDIHGQFGDLQRFFAAYGSPNPYTGDVEYVNYCFLGDYVDRGKHSLEVICLLLALKICHPTTVTLLRGNHEDAQVNAVYGFRAECMRRCHDGAAVWAAVNRVFEWLPVAALVDDCVLCVHGGIGEQLQTLQQLKDLPRPAVVDLSRRSILNEILWSDPTDSDERVGCHPNARGPNTVSYGPDRVRDFCDANGLKLLVRAHQCVQDGFEWCAHGRLLTVFSAPDYGARWKNDAAMLVLNRELHVFPKVLRSRGRAAAMNDWVDDPKRPFTPPRPRPMQTTSVVPRVCGEDGGERPDRQSSIAEGGDDAGGGGENSDRLGCSRGRGCSVVAAVPTASPVTVSLDAPLDALGDARLETLSAAELADGVSCVVDDEAEGAILAQQMADTILS